MTCKNSSITKKNKFNIDTNRFAQHIKDRYELTSPDTLQLKNLADACSNEAKTIEQAIKNAWANSTTLDKPEMLRRCQLTLSHLQAMACMNGLTLLHLAHQYTKIPFPSNSTQQIKLWIGFFEMTKLPDSERSSHQMQLIYTTTSLTAASSLLMQFANAKTLTPPDPDYYTRLHAMRLVFVRTAQMIALNNSTLLDTIEAIIQTAQPSNHEGQL